MLLSNLSFFNQTKSYYLEIDKNDIHLHDVQNSWHEISLVLNIHFTLMMTWFI